MLAALRSRRVAVVLLLVVLLTLGGAALSFLPSLPHHAPPPAYAEIQPGMSVREVQEWMGSEGNGQLFRFRVEGYSYEGAREWRFGDVYVQVFFSTDGTVIYKTWNEIRDIGWLESVILTAKRILR